ncbi:MAG: family 16 glycosylhydrolase [Pirellulales bacterium]|nr:family 16 glycosylhydrolase [Pirellulales bacterium]
MHLQPRRRIDNQSSQLPSSQNPRRRGARRLHCEALERRDLLTIPPTLQPTDSTPVLAPLVDTASLQAAAATMSFADHGQLIANPGAGWQAFYSGGNTSGFPTSTVYARFDWADIEPVVGQYNFSQIDQVLAGMSATQRLALRIMTFNEDAGPVAYANAGLSGNWASYAGQQRFQPNLNNAAVQTAVTNFINALGQRYGNTGRLDSVDVGFYGPWGEWSETNVFNVPLPTRATCAWLVNTLKAAFPGTPIIANAYMTVVPGAFEDAMAAGLGWRGDSWGDHPRAGASWTNQGDLYDPIIAQFPNQWKTSPIYMEPAGIISQWASYGYDWNTVAQWTINNHISAIHGKTDNLSSALKSQISALLLKIGYRPLIAGLSLSGNALSVTIRNNGNAPAYVDRYLRIVADGTTINTTVNLKGLLPGDSQFTITNDKFLTAGTLALGFVNSAGVADIQLAQSGTTANMLSVTIPRSAVTASITGPTSTVRGQSTAFTLAVAGWTGDPNALFTFNVNWGDGSALQTVSARSGTQISHTFGSVGTKTISVTATPPGGVASAAATRQVTVASAQLLPNAQNAALRDLVWVGTTGDDQVTFAQVNSTTIRVTTLKENGATVNYIETFSGVTGRLLASGDRGNDTLDAVSLTTTRATLDGGAGNNTLKGGQAGDILIGGYDGGAGQQGNNVIIAGNGANTIYGNGISGAAGATAGNHLIVGGSGADTIYGAFGTVASNGGEGGRNLIIGGGGADTIYASQTADGPEGGHGSILVSGTTTLNLAALQAVLAEWTSNHSYAERVANIQGLTSASFASRLNGTNYLKVNQTVANDTGADKLWGDSNGQLNWFLFGGAQDSVVRIKAGETLTNLSTSAAAALPTLAPGSGVTQNWTLTMAEEFSGTALDASRWSPNYFWSPTVINGELQDYLPQQVSVSGGICTLRAERAGARYNSGVISSFGKFSQAYGFFEARLKWPGGPGTWPAFWLYAEDRSWPPEIDIMEANGYRPRMTWPNYHWLDGATQRSDPTYIDTGVDLTAGFHTYGLLWQPGLLVWYVDGQEVKRVSGSHVTSQPMHLNLNLAIAPPGNPGMPTPDATTAFPSQMQIDYVRVWR